MGFLIVLVVMLALMWLLFVRPQRRRQVEQSTMLENLDVGDEILTAGGMYGTIYAIDEDEITLEIAPGTNVRLARRAVAAVMPPDDKAEETAGELEEAEAVEAVQEPDRADAAPR